MQRQVKENTSCEENTGCNIGVRLYNAVILIIDIIVLFLKLNLYAIEGIIRAFILPESKPVKDQIVLITGAAHGIGRQLAVQYGDLGAKVVCWDINSKGNLEVVEEIKSRGGQAYSYICDVVKRENIFEIAKKVKEDVGIVKILVNNAGIMPCHPLLQHTEAEIRKIYDINVLAHFWMLQAFLPDMIEQNEGHIVALSSCAGLFGFPNLVPYCGSKYDVRGIMQSLQQELRNDTRKLQIKFTTVYPYMVDTGLCMRPYMRFPNFFKMVKPEDAASAIIDAQRREIEEVSIPKYYLYLERIGRLYPAKVLNLIKDFCDVGLHSDL